MKTIKPVPKTPAKLLKQYLAAREEYYNTGEKTTLTDAQYDKLEEEVKKFYPNEVAKTGVLGKKKPIALVAAMPSLEKCKAHESTLPKFLKRLDTFGTAKVVMEKLDGSSVQAVYEGGKLASLATRGDGITGQDITFLAKHTTLPQRLTTKCRIVIRMEAVISKEAFKKHSKEVVSGRAAVSGALNRTDASPILKDIDFVVLRILQEDMPLAEGLAYLEKQGFMVVRNAPVKNPTDALLSKTLQSWKEHSKYEMDGLVVHANVAPLSELAVQAKKPKFAFAYKLDEETDSAALTTITDIVWKKSAFGVLVPKAIVKPVNFDGVTVRQVALHNYALCVAKKTGIGAKVRIIRSGDIIPKIVKVEKGAEMCKPSVKEFGAYSFNGTDLVVSEVDNNHKELLVRFFSHTGLDGFGPALAEALAVDKTPTWDVLRSTQAKHWMPYTNDSAKTSVKLAQEVLSLRDNITLDVAMAASGVFGKGVGKTRVRSLIAAWPLSFDRLTMPYSIGNRNWLVERASETAGCGPAFAALLKAGFKDWCEWYKNSMLDIEQPVMKAGPTTKSKYTGKLFSFTGYRDKSQEAEILQGGGQVVSLGGKTNVLFYNPAGKFMAKVEAAREKGITVIEFKYFKG